MNFRRAALVLAFFLLLGSPPVVLAGSIEGRWVLTEQYYAGGASNLVSETDAPLSLEFVRDATGLRGLVWRGTDRSAAQDWPTLADAAGTGPVSIERLEPAADETGIKATYLVAPSATDDLTLRVVEWYRLVDDEDVLAGRVEVTFVRDGETRGSYVLRRRFERQP